MLASLLPLLIWGGMAIVVVGGIFGFIHSHDAGVANKQKMADQVVLTVCAQDRDKAVGANVSLQLQIQKILADEKLQNEAAKKEGDAKDAAQRVKDRLNAKAQARVPALDADSAKSAGRIGVVKPGETCEAHVARVYARLRELASVELRDRAASVDGSVGGDTSGPGSGESVHPVR